MTERLLLRRDGVHLGLEAKHRARHRVFRKARPRRGPRDDRVLPRSAEAREVGDSLRADYSSKDIGALSIVFPQGSPDDTALDAYAVALSTTTGVSRVDTATGVYLQGVRATTDPTNGNMPDSARPSPCPTSMISANRIG